MPRRVPFACRNRTAPPGPKRTVRSSWDLAARVAHALDSGEPQGCRDIGARGGTEAAGSGIGPASHRTKESSGPARPHSGGGRRTSAAPRGTQRLSPVGRRRTRRAMTTTTTPRARGIEVRSIDYVPLGERHGKVRQIGPLWFMSNAQIATLATGLISITGGGNLIWSLIAIVVGIFIGTIFMAAHSSQGPQLGLPQMIQSRPQFGYIGALLVWLFAYLQYAGFNIFNTILGGEAIGGAISSGQASNPVWLWVVTIVAVVIALVGYDLIHSVERYLMILTIIVLAMLTVSALVNLHVPASQFNLADFHAVPFLGQLGVAAGYQISWAIYVSDYSRYLPPSVPTRSTFAWTFWGSALGVIWVMFLGSWIAVSAKDIGS